MASVDYTGRSVDLFIAQGSREVGESPLQLSLDSGGELIAGILKAVQTFLILFLTEKGSARDANYGTRFMRDLRGTNLNTAYVRAVFREAAEDLLEQQSIYNAGKVTTDDEIISAVELLEFATLDPSSGSMIVSLTTLAGETRVFTAPVELVIR